MPKFGERSYFLKALAAVEPGPCQLCCHRDRCAEERLACWGFKKYVNSERASSLADVDRHPNQRIYGSIFELEDSPDGGMC